MRDVGVSSGCGDLLGCRMLRVRARWLELCADYVRTTASAVAGIVRFRADPKGVMWTALPRSGRAIHGMLPWVQGARHSKSMMTNVCSLLHCLVARSSCQRTLLRWDALILA